MLYVEWKAQVVAKLTFSGTLIRERDWKRMYIQGRSIEQAVAEADAVWPGIEPNETDRKQRALHRGSGFRSPGSLRRCQGQ